MNEPWLCELQRQLGDPRLFDEGVEAARNACVAGANIAAAAITAAAWYDNPLTGLPALAECMTRLQDIGLESAASCWQERFRPQTHPQTGDPSCSPGFGFVTRDQADMIVHACGCVVGALGSSSWPRARSYLAQRAEIEAVTGPLNAAGLAAIVFVDRGVDRDEAERRYLGWRMDAAIAQAQQARARGVGAFPFFADAFVYEGTYPPKSVLDFDALKRQVGLD